MKTLISIISFLFLAATCNSQTIDKTERIIASLKLKYKISEYDKLDDIMCFNKDTILISGYLGDNKTSAEIKNIVYQTFNGGKTWKIRRFKGDAWIYDTHFENDGKVWMGGSDEYVHFSTDYGTTWTTKPKPFNPVNRVLSIYMIDSVNGIAGGLSNGLAITNDNWQTAKQLPTPLDQNKFSISKNSSRNRIDKVQIVDSIILINQNDHIYYSRLNHIDWQVFNIPTRNFSVNQLRKTIELYGIRNKVYVLDAKLNLLEVHIEPEDAWLNQPSRNKKVGITSFLASDIKLTNIKAVKFDFDKMSGGCMPFALYKENAKGLKVNNSESFSSLKNILTTCGLFKKPITQSFKFSEPDLTDYFSYYNKIKKQRQEEKVWGGDFTYLLDIENDLFLNPNKTIDTLSQQLLDTVYKTFSFNQFSFTNNEPYIIVNVINNKSDTLKIKSESSNLFSLPWTIEYNKKSFETYDTRITELLRATLPEGFNYYDKLFAGQLIYRLIEQRIINEMTYKNGY